VRGFEDGRHFHPERDKLVDVEEAAVVDLVGGRPPVSQTIGLVLEQVVQHVEACRMPWLTVRLAKAFVSMTADPWRLGNEPTQALPRHFLFPLSLRNSIRFSLGVQRQVMELGQDAEVLAERWIAGHLPLQPVAVQPQHARRLPWIDREIEVKVPEVQGSILQPQLQFTALEHAAILIAEHRE
jgi:hypothetical protein